MNVNSLTGNALIKKTLKPFDDVGGVSIHEKVGKYVVVAHGLFPDVCMIGIGALLRAVTMS